MATVNKLPTTSLAALNQENIDRTKAVVTGKIYYVYCGKCKYQYYDELRNGQYCLNKPATVRNYMKEVPLYSRCEAKNKENDCVEYEPVSIAFCFYKPSTWRKNV